MSNRPAYRYNPTNATVVDRRGNKVYQANDHADAMRWIRKQAKKKP